MYKAVWHILDLTTTSHNAYIELVQLDILKWNLKFLLRIDKIKSIKILNG